MPPQSFWGLPCCAAPRRRQWGQGAAGAGDAAEPLSGRAKQPAVLVRHAALLLSAIRSYECLEACYPPIKL